MVRNSKSPMVLVIVLLVITALSAYVAYSSYETFVNSRAVDCVGIVCDEGEFCQENKCHSIK